MRLVRWQWLPCLAVAALAYPGVFGQALFPVLVVVAFAWLVALSDEHSGRD